MGRPPGHTGSKPNSKTVVIPFRVTQSEAREMKRLAKAAGVSVSEYCRENLCA